MPELLFDPSEVPADLAQFFEPAGSTPMTSVLALPTEPVPFAHFACYPQKLVEPLIKAGTSEHGCCPSCGAPWRRLVETTGGTIGAGWTDNNRETALRQGMSQKGCSGLGDKRGADGQTYRREQRGWEPTCSCPPAEPTSAVVLDPFGGSGTTALVAAKLGRNAIHIDQSEQYLDIARIRLNAEQPGLGL